MKKIRSIKTEEYGFASLVVAFILILVMSLLTVGFAQLARREQQTALDQQLTNQAYYAAETGVNQIQAQIPALTAAYKANPTDPQLNGTTCLTSVTGVTLTNTFNTTNPSVSFTCALVNMTPATNSIPDTSSTGSFNYIFTSTAAMPSLTFSWGSNATCASGVTSCYSTPAPSSCGNMGCFPPALDWYAKNWPPVVQLSITPLGTGTFTRNQLITNTFTAMLYPSSGAATVSSDAYASSATCPAPPTPVTTVGNVTYVAPDGVSPDDSACNDQIVGAINTPSDTSYPFRETINGLGGTAGESWLVHGVYMYGGANTCIQAFAAGPSGGCIYTNTITTTTSKFADSQIEVDVTGKAKDVEKRLVEYLPASSGSSMSKTTQEGISTLPDYAVDTGDVCKQFTTNPETPGPGPTVLTPGAATSPDGSPYCNPDN